MEKHFVKIQDSWVDAHAVVGVGPYADGNGSVVLFQGRDDPWYFGATTPDEFIEKLISALTMAAG